MVNNICPICKAVVSENERLCPFCGTELYSKSENNSSKKKSYYDNVFDNQNNMPQQSSYVPYPQRNAYAPPQTYNYNKNTVSKNKNNDTTKKVIISLIITFVIVFGFLFTVGLIISIGDDMHNKEIRTIVDNDVETIKIPSISSEDAKPTGKVPGNTNLYQNDKYLIFKLTDNVYPEDDEDYLRNFYIYVDKPTDENTEFSCDEYSGDMSGDEYNISFNLYGDYENRAEYIYAIGDDVLTKLDNLKIGELIFEVYMIKDDTSYTYEFLSKPINEDEDYVKIHYFSVSDEIVDFKDIIRHVTTTKTQKEE